MASAAPVHFVIVGAGAAGLMAGRELARAGKRVTILEARDRCGGRIFPLPAQQFGYAAEGGAEFIHGAAAVTRGLLREAGLSLVPSAGKRWRADHGKFTPGDDSSPYADRLHRALAELTTDLPVAEFLARSFGGPQYSDLRRSITRMVEGYDAADPRRASTFALRDEWLDSGVHQQGRIGEGYGALIDFLAADCRAHGASLHLGAAVTEIEQGPGGLAVTCRDGAVHTGDAAIVTVPLPVLADIALPADARAKAAAAAADIGYGNVVKILLRFTGKFWADPGGRGLADLSFLHSDAAVPTWWTQHPASHPVLTGWLAGPKADRLGHDDDALVEIGLAGLADIFALPPERLRSDLVAARAIDWSTDVFARGAYSYATPRTRETQAAVRRPDGSAVLFSGEALYGGKDVGTVEAALCSGMETARAILDGRS